MTFAPGKRDRRWERDLDADLTRLRRVYRTGTLVSLLEAEERARLEIPDLISRARATFDDVIEHPIRDFSVPASLPETSAAVTRVLELAESGQNVVVHCYGGRGRSGLFVAACLVARGHAPDAAIAHVRAAREGTVENDDQERFVHDFARAYTAAARAETRPSFARVRGCLLGGALGDALGYPIEFIASGTTIAKRFGERAPTELAFARPSPAEISDDTQMTLFTAEGLIRARQGGAGDAAVEAVQRALHRWLSTQSDQPTGDGWLVHVPGLASRRAPGNTCLRSLRAQSRAWHLPTIASPPNDSKGCGAIMRAAPVGLVAASRERAFELARDTSVVTHGHPSGYLSAAYFAALIFDLARGAVLPEAMTHAETLLRRERAHEETLRAVESARALAACGTPRAADLEALGGGWTGESALAIALAVTLTADASSPEGFADALWRAVAHGGDSDSTGSIVGNLLGAMHGERVLPPRWLGQLELRGVLERVAADLFDRGVLDSELDHESYPGG
jgi:ADP-ribosylglycohydrolase/protein-tyrosine phosphatase